MTRLVAILGYSDGSADGLHPVCAARLERARVEAREDDVVLFSGWARGSSSHTEADLMAAAWAARARVRLVDRGARTTFGNAVGIARAARWTQADAVVLVTSGWHARRATALVRAALVGSGVGLQVAATDEESSGRRSARELGAWLFVPLLVLLAARNR